MCWCSDDDYTVSPYRPPGENPHPSVSRGHPQRQPPRQHRGPSAEEQEKRQRQAQASAAARSYGWPAARGAAGNRDSIIEPGLAGGLAAMPGSDFRAVYDPHRQRQSPQRRPVQQPVRQPVRRRDLPGPPQRPPYYQQGSVNRQGFVNQQPGRAQLMRAYPQQEARAPAPTMHQRPGNARRPVVQQQTTAHVPRQAQTARLVRRDSNGVSECSDTDDDIENLRNYTVSPWAESPVYPTPRPPPRIETRYGRNGASR
ncbi:hypothetical protein F4802DRAFT_567438 [Xylaria palmicola]|nr:hypothetical protein F4802DRAFT_567438 [Xylaria palmicola]